MLTILLVDDEPTLLGLAVRYLSNKATDEILTAPSVDTAMMILAAKPVDAIVSDYEMPGTDGIEFLKRIRTRGDTTPFIIFTGRGREVVAMQALNYGANFYLQKGGDTVSEFAELRNMIEKAVEEARALAERVEHQAQVLDEILSSIPDPVLIMDADGGITYANMAGARILGISRMAILGKHIRDLAIPENAVTPLRAAAQTVFETGERGVADLPWNGGTGVIRYRCSISPLHTTTGRINAVDIMFHDITDEARLARELKECQSQVSELLGRSYRISGDEGK